MRCIAWAKHERFTHIFAQIRGRGTVLYASEIEAPSEEMPVPFDALALAVEEAHKAGIQLHAWMNITYVWSRPGNPTSPLHPMNRFPSAVLRTKEGVYMDIRHPSVAQHVLSLVEEVAAKYPVDGIHLDYIRYPFGFLPRENDARHMTNLVERIAQKVKATRPSAALSAAVIMPLARAKRSVGQEWESWMEKGFLDFVVPMAYTDRFDLFQTYLKEVAALPNATPRLMGIGAYANSRAGWLRQIAEVQQTRARNQKIWGTCLFSYDSLIKETP